MAKNDLQLMVNGKPIDVKGVEKEAEFGGKKFKGTHYEYSIGDPKNPEKAIQIPKKEAEKIVAKSPDKTPVLPAKLVKETQKKIESKSTGGEQTVIASPGFKVTATSNGKDIPVNADKKPLLPANITKRVEPTWQPPKSNFGPNFGKAAAIAVPLATAAGSVVPGVGNVVGGAGGTLVALETAVVQELAQRWGPMMSNAWYTRQLNKLAQWGDKNQPEYQKKVQYYADKLNKVTGEPIQNILSRQGFTPQQQQQVATKIQAANPQATGNQSQQPGVNGDIEGQVPGTPQGDWFNGQRAYAEQLPLFTRNQQQYQNETIDQLRNNPADFGPIGREEINRFHRETAPQIAQHYFGNNPQSFGSSYPEALGRGGAMLGERLASLKSQYELQREANRQRIAMAPSFTSKYNPREPGFGERATNALTNAALSYPQELLKQGGQWINDTFGNKQQETRPDDYWDYNSRTQNQAQEIPFTNPSQNAPAPLSNQAGTPGAQPQDLYGQLNNNLKGLLNKDKNAQLKRLGGGL